MSRLIKILGLLVVVSLLGVTALACGGPSFKITSAELVDAPELQSVRMLIRFQGDADHFLIRFQDYHNYWPKGTDSALLDLTDVDPGRYSLDVWTNWDPQDNEPYPWNTANSPKSTASYKVDLTLDPEDAPTDPLADYHLMPSACDVEGDIITCFLVYEKQ